MTPPTTYHLVTRYPSQSPPSILYQKLPEPVPPFGLPRVPSFQFLPRLRNFPPNLDEVVVVASTTSSDIGLITKSKVPLSDDGAADKTAHQYTATTMAEDSRRATMPMSDDLADTSPIGISFDLSSKDKVQRPLPKEEYDTSQSPMPALAVLNNEGILTMWWFVYAEAVRQGIAFPGLAVAGNIQTPQQKQPGDQVSPFASSGHHPSSALGQSSFGNTSTPAASSMGSAFRKPAFGALSTFGKSPTPFGGTSGPSATAQGAQSAFGQPAFGSAISIAKGPTTQGTAFGMAGGISNRSSPWGPPSAGTAAASGSTFGQSGFSAPKASAFGTATSGGGAAPTSGAFSSFASNASPFMTATPSNGLGNTFGKSTADIPLGSGMDTDTSFGAAPKGVADAPNLAFSSGTFQLGSTFKGDGPSTNDAPKTSASNGGSTFGGDFGDALGTAQTKVSEPQTKDAEMDEDGDADPVERFASRPDEKEPMTPAATLAAPKSNVPPANMPPRVGGLFGTQAQSKTTPAAVGSSQPTGFTFGELEPSTTTPNETPKKPDQPGPSLPTSPIFKKEPQSDDGGDISPLNEQEAAPPLGYKSLETPPLSKTSEPPLPPESTSKASFAPGDSSTSSKSSDDMPLPPDFLPSKTKLKEVETARPDKAALPADDESDGLTDTGSYDEEGINGDDEVIDEEGSGINVAKDISPSTDPNHSPEITPESSFGAPLDKSPPGNLFGRVTAPPDLQKGKHLFGEVGKTPAPYLPPPSKTQQSPRSPSPVRSSTLGDSLRPDNARSVSAPGPFQAVNNRKAAPSNMAFSSKPQPSPEDQRNEARKLMAAEKASKRAQEEQDLSDREDEKVREELATEVEGTLELEPFLAHQDYAGMVAKPGIPGQIEKLYRDINSMIDTLGINARSLKAFIKGHEEQHKPDGARSIEDLDENDWCLIEIGDLPKIQDDLSEQLRSGSTEHAHEKIEECRRLRKEIISLEPKRKEISSGVDSRSSGDDLAFAKTAPLSLDQITQQDQLRKKMANFQRLLAESEENVSVLRTKLASCDTRNGKGPPLKKPTVEAVTKTIMKMTSIAEKKIADVDALENQMRTFRFSSAASQSSREGSPFNPASSLRKSTANLSASINGRQETPHRSNALERSTNGYRSPRKGVEGVSQEDVQRYREKIRRRQEINGIIKEVYEKRGPKIRELE